MATIRAVLLEKLQRPKALNPVLAARKLESSKGCVGQTYLKTVLGIIAGHPNIELVAA